MIETTPRFALPLLAAGQAQKEVLHNEALALLDTLAAPVVESADLSAPPPTPVPGQAWIVGAAATGAWAGHEGAIAAWSDAEWRFVAAPEGMCAWRRDHGCPIVRRAEGWSESFAVGALSVGGVQVVGARTAPIPEPVAGRIVDTEGRAALAAVLAALRSHGLIAA